MRASSLWLVAELAVAIPVAGQRRQLIPQPVHPAACPDGLGALGLKEAPRTNVIRAAYDSITDSSIVSLDPAPRLSFQNGVHSITGVIHFPRHAPSTLSFLQLNFLVQSPATRSAAERQVAFQLDDSTRVTIGTASAYPSGLPHGPGVLEYVFIMVPREDALRILRSATVRGSLGQTSFDVTPEERDGLRALILYVRCGGR